MHAVLEDLFKKQFKSFKQWEDGAPAEELGSDIEGLSTDVLPQIKYKRIHFAFIDGAHDYDNVNYESKFISQFQNAGDIIIFDDYNKSQYPSLVEAVDEFCKNELYSKIIIEGNQNRNYVIAKKKP